jgi:redox-sensitive bicupin YhaK (pirin superfamily)
MSWHPAHEAETAQPGVAASPLETVIVPKTRDLGGFEVRRVLPSIQRRMIGPFVFWDQMGPTVMRAGTGLDVRPHPHIGLATVTYLFEGEIVHRDSLGTVQTIRPGEVNWMTAGRGIAHSERTDPTARQKDSPMFGIQSWVALPLRDEETVPAFAHHGREALPVVAGDGKQVRLIAGALYGARSPVRTFSDMFYADVELEPRAQLEIPTEHEERAIYVVRGSLDLAGGNYEAGQLLVLKPGEAVTVGAPAAARFMLLGGEPLEGPRHMWWNFVSSSKERIERAKADWKAGRFEAVPGETEFIPLPD